MQVEQIDRDAAARWAKMQSRHAQAANMKRGACDDAPLVKLMARHRHQARAEQAAELAKWQALAKTLAGALGEIQNLHYGTEAYSRGVARIALRQYKEARDER